MENNLTTVGKLIVYIASTAVGRSPLDIQTQYPHVLEFAISSWGTPDFSEYMESLVVIEDRDFREGFSGNALSEIMKLIQAHNMIYPDLIRANPQRFWEKGSPES